VEEVASSHGIRCVFNPDYALGQSTSLIAGLNALADDTAAMFILADQPGLSVTLLRRLIEAYQQSDAPVLQPRTLHGRSGHPVLFTPALFSELRTISGDVGGRPVLQAHKNEVRYLLTDDDAVWQDLDTPEDYRRLREKDNG
jgi:molybdenum cofactor cytidylyltransferase